VLEIGAGWGFCGEELAQRSSGRVILLDQDVAALGGSQPSPARNIQRLAADAHSIPFDSGSCDLVFAQCTFLWLANPPRAIAEAARVLRPGGCLAAIEPDYGGMMEWPPEIASRDLWIAALRQAGADPLIGRKLPGWMRDAGLQVEVKFMERLKPARNERWDLLAELPLTDQQQQRLQAVRRAAARANDADVHLPYWLTLARKA
jgi:ubiquinone/menaquinone biosynthesis C-methylase UbiE